MNLARNPIPVSIDIFEGPLDLLLYLIQINELEIRRVSLSKITDQYLEFIKNNPDWSFEASGDFLLMAATLLYWKSKNLLPKDENETPKTLEEELASFSQELLLIQIIEHQRFLQAGSTLNELPQRGIEVFQRENSRPPVIRQFKSMDASQLASTYLECLAFEKKRSTILKKETVSLDEKIHELGKVLEIGTLVAFETTLNDPKSIPEKIVTFLASLELSRLKKLRVTQENPKTILFLELLESLVGFDYSIANGFELETRVNGT